jgi:hypothetical protein
MSEEITKGQINKIVSGGLRSIAASFPGFASIGQAWSEYENCRTSQRIQELIDNLKIEVGNFKERIGNLEEKFNAVAEEFPSLLEITVDKVRREFSKEKRKIYAHVLVGLAITDKVQTYDERTALIHELEVLTPIDLEALRLFKNEDISEVNNLRWQTLELPGDENEQLEQLASILAKLESRGLIITTSMPSGVTYVPNGMTNWAARWISTKYKILPLGKQLLSVIG